MLEVAALDVAYGDAPALWNVSLAVRDRELVAIVGPNGAGKTTLINAIAGLHPARGGQIRFDGHDLSRCLAHEVCGHGIAIVPEGRRLFTAMTVEENLEIGCYVPAARARRQENLGRVYSIFPILRERRRQAAGALSGGMQQMLAIGRALMAKPRLLLLDEPSLGLAPMLVREIFRIVKGINEAEGLTILVVEQDANLALGVAQHGYLIETGRVVLHDSSDKLRQNESVRKVYLGY